MDVGRPTFEMGLRVSGFAVNANRFCRWAADPPSVTTMERVSSGDDANHGPRDDLADLPARFAAAGEPLAEA